MTPRKINLLPPELKSHDGFNWRTILVRGALAAPLALLVVAYGVFLLNNNTQKDHLAGVESELTRYNKVQVELEKVKKDRQDTEKITEFLERESKNRVLWSKVMTKIMHQTVDGVTLLDMACREDDILTIQGEADDFPYVADFYLNLMNIPDLINVSIKSAARNSNESSIKYTIEGQLRKGVGSSDGTDIK